MIIFCISPKRSVEFYFLTCYMMASILFCLLAQNPKVFIIWPFTVQVISMRDSKTKTIYKILLFFPCILVLIENTPFSSVLFENNSLMLSNTKMFATKQIRKWETSMRSFRITQFRFLQCSSPNPISPEPIILAQHRQNYLKLPNMLYYSNILNMITEALLI